LGIRKNLPQHGTRRLTPGLNKSVFTEKKLRGRELFDHVIVLNVGNALRLLAEYFENYYHIGRPHQGLDGQTPKNEQGVQTEQGKVVAIPVLGGLHHRYERMAA